MIFKLEVCVSCARLPKPCPQVKLCIIVIWVSETRRYYAPQQHDNRTNLVFVKLFGQYNWLNCQNTSGDALTTGVFKNTWKGNRHDASGAHRRCKQESLFWRLQTRWLERTASRILLKMSNIKWKYARTNLHLSETLVSHGLGKNSTVKNICCG